jgi:hypothetical protein
MHRTLTSRQDGETPLDRATDSDSRSVEIVRMLLVADANTNARDKVAVGSRRLNVVLSLI